MFRLIVNQLEASVTKKYDVKTNVEDQQVDIALASYRDMKLVRFDKNANGETAENMPTTSWFEKNYTSKLPNEVPRRDGYLFSGWSTEQNGQETRYLPGAEIEVGEVPITLYAQWTISAPSDDFRKVTYVPNGDNVVLADNPQVYTRNADGFVLQSPWREDYIFTGWTCPEIGLNEPQLQVTVQCSDPIGKTDFVNRTYVANWEHEAYTVIWRNWDGSWLDISQDLYDVLPSYKGAKPVRPSDDSSFYVFAGWTPGMKAVTQDAEYIAAYNSYPLLKLVSSPVDQAVLPGSNATFSIDVDGGAAPLRYQWCVIPASQPNASSGTAIDGATSDTLRVTATDAVVGNRYYCIVQDAVGQSAVSDAAQLSIDFVLPETGDSRPLVPLLLLLVASGALLAWDFAARKKGAFPHRR